jgi:hypothetical protein
MTKLMLVFSSGLILLLAGLCSGQNRGSLEALNDNSHTVQAMLNVLWKAQVSASLEYWGHCDSQRPFPDFPTSHTEAGRREAPPLQIFREMFSGDLDMEVKQEADGTIRMVERGVPIDLLNIRIAHLSLDGIYDPRDAQWAIFGAPEVKSFMKANDIRRPFLHGEGVGLITMPTPGMRHISGSLDNVTVAQALDYILKTFPGFWIYQNCRNTEGNRLVFVEFFPVPGLLSYLEPDEK